MRSIGIACAAALVAALASPSLAAGGSEPGGYRMVIWPELQAEIFGDREILPGDDMITLDTPFRAADDRRAPVSVSARSIDGSLIRSISIIIDENPMPVSAVFDFTAPRFAADVSVDMRLNGPSPVRAVAETEDGRLFMVERMVRTSGQGACAAPPLSNTDEAIAAIGQMNAREVDAPANGVSAPRQARIDMRHPQHTGMQMDQISLLYLPARFVEEMDVWAGEEKLFTLTGSISMSEDPGLSFDLGGSGAQALRVRIRDTSDMVIERELALGAEG